MNDPDPKFWGEQAVKAKGYTCLRKTIDNAAVVDRLIAEKNIIAYTDMRYANWWYVIRDDFCPMVREVLSAHLAKLDQARGVQGPECEGAALHVFFPSQEHEVADLARSMGYTVETSIRGNLYVSYDAMRRLRTELER
jgi:hypothetical protein